MCINSRRRCTCVNTSGHRGAVCMHICYSIHDFMNESSCLRAYLESKVAFADKQNKRDNRSNKNTTKGMRLRLCKHACITDTHTTT